jgi:hypothetical protein
MYRLLDGLDALVFEAFAFLLDLASAFVKSMMIGFLPLFLFP